jgi:hypothetical protein
MAGPEPGKKAKLPLVTLLISGGGTVLVTILAFAPTLLPSIVQTYGYMLLRTPAGAQVFSTLLLLAHAYEASTAWKMCDKRGFSTSTTLYYMALTFLCGFPVLQTLKKLKAP